MTNTNTLEYQGIVLADGYTNLPTTGDAGVDHALSCVEDGLSHLYYSDLENDRGMGDPVSDRAFAISCLRNAIVALESLE